MVIYSGIHAIRRMPRQQQAPSILNSFVYRGDLEIFFPAFKPAGL